MKRPPVGRAAVLLFAAVAMIFGLTEYIYYCPLTPLSLDVQGRTRFPAVPENIRLLLVGDILLGDAAADTLARQGFDYPFSATRGLLRGADLAVGNLEGPIAARARPADSQWSYRMDPRAAHALRRTGLHALGLANNHLLDCGAAGLRETRELLTRAGLRVFGAGADLTEAHRPLHLTVRGLRIALVGHLAPEQMLHGARFALRHLAAGPRQAGVALADLDRIQQDLRAARAGSDLVLAFVHLGDRYQAGPTERERAIARALIDAGADAVIGHGPHILGPLELHRGRPILYSLGNFAFGSGNVLARFSLVALLEIDPATRRLLRLQALPLYTMNRSPWVRYASKPLVGTQARRVLEHLREISGSSGSWLRIAHAPERAVLELAAAPR